MASVTTGDFVTTATPSSAPPFSLIEHKSLPARLAEELARAWREITRDPRGFFVETWNRVVEELRHSLGPHQITDDEIQREINDYRASR